MNNSQIKRLARIRLAGNWGNCVALSTTLISFATMIALGELIIYNITVMIGGKYTSYFDYISSPTAFYLMICRAVIYYLLFVPEVANLRGTYISLSQGKSFLGTQWELRHIGAVHYVRIILLQTLSLIYQAMLLIPLAACCFGVAYYIELCRQSITTRSLLMFMLCLLMAIIMLSVFIYFKIKLRLIPYIAALHPETGIIDTFILSSRLMRGNVIRYLVFQLSFLHYLMMCLLIFPIIVVIPYYYMSVAVLCSELVTDEAVREYMSGKES